MLWGLVQPKMCVCLGNSISFASWAHVSPSRRKAHCYICMFWEVFFFLAWIVHTFSFYIFVVFGRIHFGLTKPTKCPAFDDGFCRLWCYCLSSIPFDVFYSNLFALFTNILPFRALTIVSICWSQSVFHIMRILILLQARRILLYRMCDFGFGFGYRE